MGGGRSGLYHKTTGAKSVGLPLIGGAFGITPFPPQNTTGASFHSMGGNGGFATNTGYSSSKKIVEFVVALIWRGDKLLICQRAKNNTQDFLWEFVNGKALQDETKEQALIRECRKKLAVTVKPNKQFMEVKHEYSDIIVNYSVFNCSISNGEPRHSEYSEIRWITVKELDNYSFCSANKQILEKIKNHIQK